MESFLVRGFFAILSMDVIYRLEKSLYLTAVAELYRSAGWMSAGEEASGLAPMLRNSFAVMAAFDAATGRLVGMMRALSDGCSDAYLLDLVVRPEARRQGIGRESDIDHDSAGRRGEANSNSYLRGIICFRRRPG